MITILKTTDQGLEKIEELADGSWVNLINPGSDEVARLRERLAIPTDFFTYPLDLDEQARVEREDGALLIIVRVPEYVGEGSDVPYTTLPLGIVLTDKTIATICRQRCSVVEELATGRMRGLSTTKRNRFVLQLLLLTAKRYLQYLKEINKMVDFLEDKLQLSLRNREVLELLKYQKSLTYFTTALKGNEMMMARLERGHLFHMYPDDEDLLDDVQTEIGQAIEMTAISSGILSQMMDAFASIISNNLNVVMKFLASVTIILALPAMVASIYGMNITLPLAEHPLAFWITMGISAAISLVVIVIFARKDWL
ncbi:MAG: magnesium transporter CorA family protein [Chloroflexota bacterium]